jgi:hypothetical protein
MLALTILLCLVSAQLPAQTIDTEKLQNTTPLPPDKKKGVDPDTITKTSSSNMRISDVRDLAVARTTQVSIQGRGQVRRTELSYSVTVKNTGSVEQNYRIQTEVHGTATPHRSPQNRLLSGKDGRQTIRFTTEFTLPAGSNQLQISVVLLDGSGVAIDRTTRQVDMTAALASLNTRPATPAARARDLAVTDLIVFPSRGRLDIGPVNVGRSDRFMAAATVRNVGSERWGYPASLTIRYHRGRPGALSAMDGASGSEEAQTFAMPPGEQTVVTYIAPETLTPGYYYTATAQVLARDDQNRSNDARQFVFFLETDRRITPADAD